MSATALVATLAVVLATGLLLATVSLGREVRRLRSDVEELTRRPVVGTAEVVAPGELQAQAQAPARPDDVVLTPTPIGRPDGDLDLSVSRVASVTLAGPLIKGAAFAHGVRRALAEETRMRAAHAFRKELRRQRKLRRRRAAAGSPGPEGHQV